MIKYTTVFADLLRPLSRSDFQSAISGYKADHKVRVLSCYDLFKAMIYGQVSGCFSVREIEASMKANRSRLYHAGIKQPIKRSTFCDALEKRRHEVFRFKWIKQHLKVKSFWGTSMNAVYSQIWAALILTLLLWINRTLNGFSAKAPTNC